MSRDTNYIINLVKKDNRLYNDINNIIKTYIPENNLYKLYKKIVGCDYLDDYFQILNYMLFFLLESEIIIGDSNKVIKKGLIKIKEDILYYLYGKSEEIDDLYKDIDYKKYYEDSRSIIEKKSNSIYSLNVKQLYFIKNHIVPYLYNSKNIFNTILYKYPQIEINYNDKYKKKIKNYILLKDLIKVYTKIYLDILIRIGNDYICNVLIDYKIVNNMLIINISLD